MALRTPERPSDPNKLAKAIVDLATGETEEKAPLARARKGGLKGRGARQDSYARAAAMAAGVTDKLWEIGDIVAPIEAEEAQKPMARGAYKARQ